MLEQLRNAPNLGLLHQEISRLLAEERQGREKFHEEITPSMKAEFINGQVVLHAPTQVRYTTTRMNLSGLLRTFVSLHELGLVLDEKAMVSLTRNDCEPDVIFHSPAKAATLKADQLLLPAPDFVAEVLSPSTETVDRGIKFEDYAAHGIAEYWLLNSEAEVLEQFRLVEGRSTLRLKSGDGHARSDVVPGFVIPVRALFDAAENLATLRQFTR